MLLNGEFLQDFSKKKPPVGKIRVTLMSQEIVWGGFSTKGHGDMSFSFPEWVVVQAEPKQSLKSILVISSLIRSASCCR